MLITGSSDGLGRAVARHAHAQGWAVLAHGRDEAKLAAVAEELPGTRTLRADLACLRTVERLAGEVLAGTDRLDALVCNAGVGTRIPPHRAESVDGIELRFAVNYLACYALVRRLLGLLRASAPARIVFVASAGQMRLDFSDLMLDDGGYSGIRAYCQSKLAQIMLAFDLAAELDPSEIAATALHPGTYMPTKIVTAEGISPLTPLEHGVDATWRLVADPALAGVSGVYFNQTRETRPEGQALDADARRALHELSERLTGV